MKYRFSMLAYYVVILGETKIKNYRNQRLYAKKHLERKAARPIILLNHVNGTYLTLWKCVGNRLVLNLYKCFCEEFNESL